MEYKFYFKVGDSVIVQDHMDANFQEQGIVERIDIEDFVEPYLVSFSEREHDCDWYGADKLQLTGDVKTTYKPSEETDATQVSTEGKQGVVELPMASEGRKYDSGKPMYNLLPADALEEVVKVLTFGATKYNEPAHEENWRKVQHPEQRYFAAMQRHVWATRKGEMNDPESGISHYAHAITNLLFLLQAQLEQSKGETK